MLKIRLQRVGRKHEPAFRVVLTDSKNSTKSGKFLEVLGSYDPRGKRGGMFNKERITHWISKGTRVSDTMHNLLVKNAVISGKKIDVSAKKKKKKGEAETEAKAVPESGAVKKEVEQKVEQKTEAPKEETVKKEALMLRQPAEGGVPISEEASIGEKLGEERKESEEEANKKEEKKEESTTVAETPSQ